MFHLLLLLGSLSLPIQDFESTPEDWPEQWIEQAWTLIPTFEGKHRAYLSSEVERNVQAAVHLLEAATLREPKHLLGLWRLGHAQSLLAENARNRLQPQEADKHFASATAALGRSLDLAPNDPWAAYAQGVAYTARGEHEVALQYLAQAVANGERKPEESEPAVDHAWIRFKALEWQFEVMLRAQRSEEARTALRSFHTEFSNNEWPMQIALAESYLREWNLDGARSAYEAAIALFPDDSQAHAVVGYLEGLLGNNQLAVEHLQRTISLEVQITVWPRLWLVLLTSGSEQATAKADLARLLKNPPSSVSPWEVTLGKFVLGEGDPSAFIESGKAELQRRINAEEATDDLMCEVHFYAGWRLEHSTLRDAVDASAKEISTGTTATTPAPDSTSNITALDCYRNALLERPNKWKWEWAYSRLQLAQLAKREDVNLQPSFTITDNTFQSRLLSGTLERVLWSTPLSARPTPQLGQAPQVGDLLMGTVVESNGQRQAITRIVGED